MESKKYSWAWVTASRLLSHGPCELIYAHVTSIGTSSGTIFYDGENASGDIIVSISAVLATGIDFCPETPIYCRKGLYVTKGTNATGIFVQWRELGHKEG